ncbi:uncharacterized protein LOC108475003 [Gossypium arboreum]|uniref:uncharacterized protein LOC108475003 n=1 Tax=Gossypium arboreum TaxID=29729 RepID=UPI0008194B2A|nr:uncharacterized protein LOC108475003 [Gossypium arboreum]
MVEKESSLSLYDLRTDRGEEFNSEEFSNFCKVQGIKRQLTTAYMPQQNRVTECKNHTILNMCKDNKILIVSLYVGDLILTSNDLLMMQGFKNSMKNKFEMIDLGEMKNFLDMEVYQGTNGIFINQKKYVNEVFEKFKMGACNGIRNLIAPGSKLSKEEERAQVDGTLFKQIVKSLMYMTVTIPELIYSRNCTYELTAYIDNDYARDLNDQKSTSGFAFMLSG